MTEALIALIPIIAASLTPPLVAFVRAHIAALVPDKLIPVLLPVAGGVLAGIAHLLGVDATVLQATSSDPNAWVTVTQGILAGSAAVGVHQIAVQVKRVD